jgi:glycosyltransferase involved in cell wall biosynthesis
MDGNDHGNGPSRRRFDQLVHTLSYGDAISTEVIALQRVFIEAGFESAIFAINVHPFYLGRSNTARGPIKKFGELQRVVHGEASLLLHYSLGSPLNELFREIKGYRRGLVYHNLTPAHFFEGINPVLVQNLSSGSEELPALCELCDFLVADSEFNAADLKRVSTRAREHGVVILPLLVEPSRFSGEANPGFAALLRGTKGINVLHVGRLVPNKGYEAIVRAFYFLRKQIDPEARLWLVGIDIDSELYSFTLKRMVDAWGLTDAVEFLGQRSDGELRALYENCSVYLCLSEHEGFCLPVIEAMHFGLPVVSTSHGALAETIADGGVLIDAARPSLVAELVAEVAKNGGLRERVIGAGRKRVSAFSPELFYAAVQRDLISSAR